MDSKELLIQRLQKEHKHADAQVRVTKGITVFVKTTMLKDNSDLLFNITMDIMLELEDIKIYKTLITTFKEKLHYGII